MSHLFKGKHSTNVLVFGGFKTIDLSALIYDWQQAEVNHTHLSFRLRDKTENICSRFFTSSCCFHIHARTHKYADCVCFMFWTGRKRGMAHLWGMTIFMLLSSPTDTEDTFTVLIGVPQGINYTDST